MADFEKIDMSPSDEASRYAAPDFAKVVFHNISESYPTGAHVSCRYVVTSGLEATSRDWVGLYRVGWSSSRDYVYFLWAAPPADPTVENDVESAVMFQAHTLPADDGDFYQFCYVSSSGHVRGASTPFQFRRPGSDDYVAVEDEDDDMMIVKTKTRVLEDKIEQAEKDKNEIAKKLSLLEEERESLLTKLVQTDYKLRSAQDKQNETRAKLEASEEKVGMLASELQDITLIHEALAEKMNTLEQEKASILFRLSENDNYISSLQSKIKSLVNEKDALSGQVKSLEEEKDMLQNYFTNSESSVLTFKAQISLLQQQIADKDDECINSGTVITQLSDDMRVKDIAVSTIRSELEKQEAVVVVVKEQLTNTADKLKAAEECMKQRQNEINALRAAFEKVASGMETSRSESHAYKTSLERITQQYSDERVVWDQQARDFRNDIELKEKEKSYLNAELEQATSTLNSLKERSDVEREGSMFALRKAHQHLRDQYESTNKKLLAQEKHVVALMTKQKQMLDVESDLLHEIRDLKERLSMGADEYKLKYLECRRLQTELRKLKNQGSARCSIGSDSSFGIIPGHVEQVRTEAIEVQTEAVPSRTGQVQTDTVCSRTGTMQTEPVQGGVKNTQTEPLLGKMLQGGVKNTQTEPVPGRAMHVQTAPIPGRALHVQTEPNPGMPMMTQTDRHVETTNQTQTDRSAEMNNMTQTESRIEAHTTTQTDRNGEAHNMTQTEHRVEANNMTQTDRKFEAETTTQTERKSEMHSGMQTESKVETEIHTQTDGSASSLSNGECQTERVHADFATADQIQTELDNLAQQLEQHHARQNKYKQMFEDEREKNKTLQRVYHDQLTEKNETMVALQNECLRLRRLTRDTPSALDITKQEVAREERVLVETVHTLDPAMASRTESALTTILAPMSPLPHPIQPTLLPDARVAAVRAASFPATTNITPDLAACMAEDMFMFCPEEPTQETEPVQEPEFDEERFEDADGEPQKLCPVCNTTFPADLPQVQFEQHVDAHYGATCPMCKQTFPVNFDQECFEEHVNNHFQDDSSLLIVN